MENSLKQKYPEIEREFDILLNNLDSVITDNEAGCKKSLEKRIVLKQFLAEKIGIAYKKGFNAALKELKIKDEGRYL